MRTLVLAVTVALTAGAATAQPTAGANPRRPPFSPYLNLLNGNNSTGFNYYGLVRPQVEFNNNINRLQQHVADNRDAINTLGASANSPALPTTGHGVTFLNTGSYFSRQPAGGGTAVPRPGGGAASAGGVRRPAVR